MSVSSNVFMRQNLSMVTPKGLTDQINSSSSFSFMSAAVPLTLYAAKCSTIRTRILNPYLKQILYNFSLTMGGQCGAARYTN